MKKIRFKKSCLIASLILIILAITGYYNRNMLIQRSSDWLAEQTIPFNWLVSPQSLNKTKHQKGLALNELNTKNYTDQLNNIDHILNGFHQAKQNCNFLSQKQNKQLQNWVQKKPHRYLYSVTPVTLGKDLHGNYVVVSANRYDDTKNIVSYRYRVYFQNNKVLYSQFIGQYHNNHPPKFIAWSNNLGDSGISKTPNFIEQINSVLINSGITTKTSTATSEYKQLARNLGLHTTSTKALAQYAKQNGADANNSVIITYEFSDVPRETRFLLKQWNNNRSYYYTLIYDRNQNKFIDFQVGKKLISQNK
ncbi:hypothetical protein [Bombilactobacillus thymidiniphilus]|uniref:Uncharacterized protein n=1 Tax=Bombilactobacillus thymidiniphilus TaxID=2923363 RepID=A0ABY4PFF4_9LACO|nr:hypothetical protein [Bombilactobacillus thymidiniphilus]UQS84315.1 hypothetical protein MOO47_03970 [Bombilactobacillus thymidiniphilus]